MLLVEHAVGDVSLVAQSALAVVQRDVDGVVVAHVAGDVSAQGDLGVTGGDRTTEFHFQFGGHAGGLQAPLFACAGAKVTVIDISAGMLEKDREIAARENLPIEIVKGNICDLSMFADESFDLIFNPPSLMYIPDVSVVFRECFRVLAKGGEFILMAPAPINYVCDWVEDEQGGYYKAVNRMPWCSRDFDDSGWIEYGHTMEEYLGGLTGSGFAVTGYLECQAEDITCLNFLVRAVKQTGE